DSVGYSKVLVHRQTINPYRTEGGTGGKAYITVMLCGSATGFLWPPFIIYKSKRLFQEWCTGGPADAGYSNSDNQFSCSATKFIDVRTYREYSGEVTGYSYVKIAGRIPHFQFDLLDGNLTWQELEEYLELMRQSNSNNRRYKRLIYMCGTGWRARVAVIFADELNLAEILTVLDSGWYEWSERFFNSNSTPP
ncbi:unnamed protein product, partial [Adineta ricciae]